MLISWQFARYLVVGGTGTLLHLAVMVATVELLGWAVTWGAVLGFLSALLVSFVANYRWTFASTRSPVGALGRYTLVCVSGLLLNLLMMHSLVALLDIWYLTAQIAVIWVVPVINYLLNRYWSF